MHSRKGSCSSLACYHAQQSSDSNSAAHLHPRGALIHVNGVAVDRALVVAVVPLAVAGAVAVALTRAARPRALLQIGDPGAAQALAPAKRFQHILTRAGAGKGSGVLQTASGLQ